MENDQNDIWIINGIPGSGKSTTARALAKRLPHSAHIEGDAVHDLIISGKVSPGQAPQEEENRQIHLCVMNQCLLARSFQENGFIPVIDYVVVNRRRVEEYRGHLMGFRLLLVTLDPGVETALQRDADRPEKTVAHLWVHLYEQMKQGLAGMGLWVDNGTRSIDETVEYILHHKNAAQV